MRNLTMMTDLYELTMMYGYYKHGMEKNKAVFDLFYRRRGELQLAVAAGLEQVIDYVNSLRFEDDDIEYLRSLNLFDEDFLTLLKNLKFTGEIYAIPEGTVVFPMEPLIRVYAPILEAQLLETAILNLINHQTLIATKAQRVIEAACGDSVMEFGLRRAQGPDAAIYGARAAIISGCSSTSNVLTSKLYGVPASGTHAHSWVMSFSNELEAFRAYARTFPDACLLLVDTYNVLKSGIPNAIKVFDELRASGHEPIGIRIDSGDLAYLSIEARKMLDKAGYPNTKIVASSDLDEEVIWELKAQGAKIDTWGVGTKLITSYDNPALGGVYKMSMEEVDGVKEPRIKISENPEKVTNPGYKKVYRIYNKDDKSVADLIALADEKFDTNELLTIFDPIDTWKRMTLTEYSMRELLIPVFVDGKQVYKSPSLKEISDYAKKDLETFYSEYRRIHKPHTYKVDLSKDLYDLKQKMLLDYNPGGYECNQK